MYGETLYRHRYYFFYLLREGYLTASYKSKTIHIVLISKRSHKFIVQLHVIPVFYFFVFYFLQQSESRANSSHRILQTVNQHTECSPRDIKGYYIYSSNGTCRPNYHYVYDTGTTFILNREAATEISYVLRKVAYLMSARIFRVTLLEIQPRLFNYSSHSLLVLPLVFLI